MTVLILRPTASSLVLCADEVNEYIFYGLVVVCSVNGCVTHWSKQCVLRCTWDTEGNPRCWDISVVAVLQNTPRQVH